MTAKRKISVRKVLQAFVTLIVTTGCIVAVLGASGLQQQKKVGRVYLNIRNENKYQFLDKQALWNDLVEKRNIKTNKTGINKLDIKAIEASAYKNPWVSEAQVYMDNSRNVHIYVTQRIPVARIFMENGESRYLDTALNLLPLSDQFTYYTTIVTNVPVLGKDSLSADMKSQVVKLVRFIEKDSFWNALIEQIIVTPDRKFELIPVMGRHKILIGDTSRLPEKFNNLFAFYKKVLNRIGWDKYDLLDVRFKDQVVASPSLPWKPSSKNAISNMDWVKNIIGPDSGKITQASAAPKPVSVVLPAKTQAASKAAQVHKDVKPASAQQSIKKEPSKPVPAHAAPKPAKEPAKKEPIKKEPAKKELAEKEPVKKEAAKKEPVKPVSVKKEARSADKAKTTPKEKKEIKANDKSKKTDKEPAAKYIYKGN